MTDGILYAFEELSDDLPRPPLVAVRALLASGLVPTPHGWSSLPVEVRVAIAQHGTVGVVDTDAVRELAQKIPPRHIKLVSRSQDPDPDEVPGAISKALGPARPISNQEWRALRAVDRAVLASLAANSRLIARAHDELAEAMGKSPSAQQTRWSGAIARCELHVREEALNRLVSGSFLDGRALMLARVAGIRAARRIHETLDLQADSATGPVEIDGVVQFQRGCVLWQAHVSTWDGAFFPAAALLAATTAGTALFDMIKEEDPGAWLDGASIREEAWSVGGGAVEESTQLYAPASWASSTPAHLNDVREIADASEENARGAVADQLSGSNPVSSGKKDRDLAKTIVDPGSAPGPQTTPVENDTLRDMTPGIGAMIDAATSENFQEPQGAQPLEAPQEIDAPSYHGGFASLPPAPPSGDAPALEQSSVLAGTSTPKVLVGLFVASFVILVVALAIFGYVLSRSM